ncbi:unnamed protein product [Effrenium voratum]|nr:unnamed protein product [Effrenium voratum]
MAPKGSLSVILGILAGVACVLLTAPDTSLRTPVPALEVEQSSHATHGAPVLERVLLAQGALPALLVLPSMPPRHWTLHSWQECLSLLRANMERFADGRCHACHAEEGPELRGLEAQFHYQPQPQLPACTPTPPTPGAPAPAPAPPVEPPAPEPAVSTPKPAPYILNVGKNGLPVADTPRPKWLVKEDELVIDARPQPHGGMLIVQPVLMDAGGTWGKSKAERPRWLRAILATNRNHARLHGHVVILRWQPTQPQLTKWQKRQCSVNKLDERTCTKHNERENFNWEKHLMLHEYLVSPQNFSHVLMLDADAALVKHSIDILGGIARDMEKRNLDVFLTSEDWLLNGENRINGGFLMTRNTPWSQKLFQDTFQAHVKGPGGLRRWRIGLPAQECSSNEQICLNDVMSGSNKELVKGHMALESGVIYNRGGCTVKHCGEPISDPNMEAKGMKDERLQVLHFMGGSKHLAPEALCEGGKDYTGDGPKGYGCHK